MDISNIYIYEYIHIEDKFDVYKTYTYTLCKYDIKKDDIIVLKNTVTDSHTFCESLWRDILKKRANPSKRTTDQWAFFVPLSNTMFIKRSACIKSWYEKKLWRVAVSKTDSRVSENDCKKTGQNKTVKWNNENWFIYDWSKKNDCTLFTWGRPIPVSINCCRPHMTFTHIFRAVSG